MSHHNTYNLFLNFILLIFPFGYLTGQTPTTLVKNPEYFIDSLASIKAGDILKMPFYPFNHYFQNTPQALPVNKNIWIRYTIANNNNKDSIVYFYSGNQQKIEAFLAVNGKVAFIGSTGSFIPASQLNIPGNRSAIMVRLPVSFTSTIYIKVFNYTTYHVDPFQPALLTRQELDQAIDKSKQQHASHDIKYAYCFGMFIIMFFYVLIKFFYIPDKAYLWYALFIFCSFCYFLLNYFHQPFHDYILSENPFLLHLISDPFILLQIIFYQFFVIEFLYLQKTDKLLQRLLKVLSFLLGIYVLLGTVYVYITKEINGRIAFDKIIGLSICFIGLFAIYRIYALKTILSRILLCGVICMIIFSALSLIEEYAREYYNFLDPAGGMFHLDLLLIGTVAEILFFTLSLGYRERLMQKEKLHYQKELVKQYEKTVRLQNEYQQELEKEVTQKTEQILLNIQVLDKERNDKIKAELNRQIAETEMKALRAQMNPHFIFNCLSTIESYIYQSQPHKASKMLQKFALLTRLILDNSMQPFITVCKEAEALKLYIELEKERSNNRFNYSLKISEDCSAILIPPMLVQPLVENAILHGLRSLKEIKGDLKVSISKVNDHLYCSVEDNGIGLVEAKKIKENNSQGKSSYGITIIKERLAILCDGTTAKSYLTIIDKQLPDRGVLAEILLPVL